MVVEVITMTVKKWDRYLLTFQSDDQEAAITDIVLIEDDCAMADIGDYLFLIVSPEPLGKGDGRWLTISMTRVADSRIYTTFVPDLSYPAPKKPLRLRKKWLERHGYGEVLHIRILPRRTAHEAVVIEDNVVRVLPTGGVDKPRPRLLRLLRHYVQLRIGGASCYTRDLWEVLSSDELLRGIQRVSVRRELEFLFPSLPRSRSKRIGRTVERYWRGFGLREEPPVPSCPVGCSCWGSRRRWDESR